MTITIKHSTQVDTGAFPDDPAYPVGSDEWNEAHTLQQATARLLGRVSSGAGATEELTQAQVQSFIGRSSANGVASLGPDGKVPSSQLPTFGVLTKYYESPETVVTANSQANFTHALGEVPKIIQVFVKFKVAAGGYGVNDLAFISSGSAQGTNANQGFPALVNSSSIVVKVLDSFRISSLAGTVDTFTISSDRPIVVRAFA